jgi:hypothetical protein
MKSMCCLCIQFTHENTSERTILHLVKKNILGLVACTAKKASYPLNIVLLRDVFHIGLVIGPRPAVLAWGAAEHEAKYSRPRTYN